MAIKNFIFSQFIPIRFLWGLAQANGVKTLDFDQTS